MMIIIIIVVNTVCFFIFVDKIFYCVIEVLMRCRLRMILYPVASKVSKMHSQYHFVLIYV